MIRMPVFRSLITVAAALMVSLPAQAALLDFIDGLTKKISEGDAAAQIQLDTQYEQDLRRDRPAFVFDTPAAAQSGRYVEVERGETARELKKVGIINFAVEFIVERETSALGSNRSRRISLGIPSPDTARMQAIVEELYAKTVADLQGLGLEVLPYEQIKATKNYKEIEAGLKPSPWSAEVASDVDGGNGSNSSAKSIFVAPAGMGMYPDNPKRLAQTVSAGLGGMFGTNFPLKMVMIGYDLNREVELLTVNLVVDFSVMRTTGRSLLNVAQTRSASLHHLQSGNSHFVFRSVRNVAPALKLKQAVVSDKAIMSPAKVRRGATEVEGTATGSTISVKFDGMDFDADTYYRRSAEMLEATRQMFIAELRRLRS